VLVAGGLVNNEDTLPDGEVYDPGSGQWTPTGPLFEQRIQFGLHRLPDGRVLAAGGYTAKQSELYDPVTGQWSAAGRTAVVHMAPTISLLGDGRLLLTAGYHGAVSEVFTPWPAPP
jgi:hypothetical protein